MAAHNMVVQWMQEETRLRGEDEASRQTNFYKKMWSWMKEFDMSVPLERETMNYWR